MKFIASQLEKFECTKEKDIVTETTHFLRALLHAQAILISVHATKGSVPREVGAWMGVFADATVGTVGGGRLEWDAMAYARKLLARQVSVGYSEVQLFRLGPRLGQCCGGEVQLRFERVDANDVPALQKRLVQPLTPVALFGGGHVGAALVEVLSRLPYAVQWIDSRDEVFPALVPANVQCEHSDPVHAAVDTLPAGSRVVIMSFSHSEDRDIVAACLQRQRARGDLPYVGLIGSATKWASFRQQLESKGFSTQELAHITCPIGVAGIKDKRPAVIAVAIAAQLLQAGLI